MTTLTIIPNYEKKRLKLVGTVAAGEHVAVTVVGGGDWTQGGTLRLRALFGGKTVAVFPYYTEQREVDGQTVEADAWGGTEDATCELNLNTIQAEKMLRFGGECLWVLDDPANHTLYGTGEFRVNAWPKHRPVDVPYDLDNYPDLVKELSDDLAELSAQLTLLDHNKVDKVAGKSLSTNDYTTAEKTKLSGIEAGAQANVGVEFTQGEKTKLAGIAKSAKDNVVEAASSSAFPVTGEAGKIYVAKDANKTYRWSGTQYVEVGGGGSSVDVVPPSTDASAAGKAADAKSTGDALYTGFTAWELSGSGYDPAHEYEIPSPPVREEDQWDFYLSKDGDFVDDVYSDTDTPTSLTFPTAQVTATRHLITPTKTSQLINDGAPNGGGTPYATTAQVAAKQDALSAAQLANIAAVPNKANSADVAAAIAGVRADLPYAMVTPGEWTITPAQVEGDVLSIALVDYGDGDNRWCLYRGATRVSNVADGDADDMFLDFVVVIGIGNVTATRASLPGHLCDRAGNRVVVTGDTTLTLPAANPGYLRDFLVRLEISGSTVPTITFSPDGNESVTYETDGDEFPVPDEAGTWLYSFTETAAHKFAVSLKKVNAVAQGGS